MSTERALRIAGRAQHLAARGLTAQAATLRQPLLARVAVAAALHRKAAR